MLSEETYIGRNSMCTGLYGSYGRTRLKCRINFCELDVKSTSVTCEKMETFQRESGFKCDSQDSFIQTNRNLYQFAAIGRGLILCM